jgi:hypothetical protein
MNKEKKMKKRFLVLVALSLSLALTAMLAGSIMAQEAPRISKEEAVKMLDNPDVPVIDVLIGRDWKASEFKIKGAIRRDPFLRAGGFSNG